jgi:hypothetical protein
MKGIVSDLLSDDHRTFVCHKTLDTERMTCAGAVAVMSKLDRLPLIARLGLVFGVIKQSDIEASEKMVIDPSTLVLKEKKSRKRKKPASIFE